MKERERGVEKEICFRKCRCGSRATYPLWNYFVPSGEAVRGNTAAGCWENSSATARIIRKINYFPSLLINFTIASMFPFPALLSRPPPLGRKGRGRKEKGSWEEGGWRRSRQRGKKRLFREVTFVPCIRVSGSFSQFEFPFFSFLFAETERKDFGEKISWFWFF